MASAKPMILLSGKRYSGKTTLARQLSEHYGGLPITQFAKPIKDGLRAMGVQVDDGPDKDRAALQDIGQYFRKRDPDYWVKQTDRVTQHFRTDYGLIIDDCRMPNELEWAFDHGFTTIRLDITPAEQRRRAAAMGLILPEPPAPTLTQRLLRVKPVDPLEVNITETALDPGAIDRWMFDLILAVDGAPPGEVLKKAIAEIDFWLDDDSD